MHTEAAAQGDAPSSSSSALPSSSTLPLIRVSTVSAGGIDGNTKQRTIKDIRTSTNTQHREQLPLHREQVEGKQASEAPMMEDTRQQPSTTFMLSCARFASAVARLSLGPLLPLLTASLKFSEHDTPALLSAFSSGYVLTQVAGGYFADRFGYRSVISASLIVSSLLVFCLTLPMAFATAASTWIQIYFLLGLVSGPLFPAGSTAITLEVRREDRATAAAIVDAAAAAGTTVAAMTPLMATYFGGWRPIFQCTSAGLLMIAYMLWNSNGKQRLDDAALVAAKKLDSTTGMESHHQSPHRPEQSQPSHQQHQQLQQQKRHNRQSPNPVDVAGSSSSWELLSALMHPMALGTYLCHGCDNFTKYSLSSWSATMLVQHHGVSPSWVGILLGMQEAIGFFSRIFLSVHMSGRELKSKRAMGIYRATVSVTSFVVQAMALKFAFGASAAIWQTVAGFMISALASGGHSIGYRPFYLEMNDKHSGSISGFGNTLASMASIAGPVLLGIAVANASGDGDATIQPGSQWAGVGSMLLLVNCVGAGTSAAMLVATTKRDRQYGLAWYVLWIAYRMGTHLVA
uniref:Major facilitator superfamily (MFS) profile domain-containing protein n=1 Tax=Craspedostauros australis TaxID=1486917 RepID=A0A7R9WM97_9STRA